MMLDEEEDDSLRRMLDDSDAHVVFQQRRIVIGYVFAAKKMNTMSVVMAEASKVPLCYSRRTGHICVAPYRSSNALSTYEDHSGGSSSSSSSSSSATSSTLSAQDVSDEYIPIRVSFVPLDLGMYQKETASILESIFFISHAINHSLSLSRHSIGRTARWKN